MRKCFNEKKNLDPVSDFMMSLDIYDFIEFKIFNICWPEAFQTIKFGTLKDSKVKKILQSKFLIFFADVSRNKQKSNFCNKMLTSSLFSKKKFSNFSLPWYLSMCKILAFQSMYIKSYCKKRFMTSSGSIYDVIEFKIFNICWPEALQTIKFGTLKDSKVKKILQSKFLIFFADVSRNKQKSNFCNKMLTSSFFSKKSFSNFFLP